MQAVNNGNDEKIQAYLDKSHMSVDKGQMQMQWQDIHATQRIIEEANAQLGISPKNVSMVIYKCVCVCMYVKGICMYTCYAADH